MEELEERVLNVDERVIEAQEVYTRRFGQVREQLNFIGQLVEEDRQFKDQMHEMREREIIVLEQKIMARIDDEVAQRKQLEAKIMQFIDSKASTLRNEILKESKTRYDALENLETCLEVNSSFSDYFSKIFQSSKKKSDKLLMIEKRQITL